MRIRTRSPFLRDSASHRAGTLKSLNITKAGALTAFGKTYLHGSKSKLRGRAKRSPVSDGQEKDCSSPTETMAKWKAARAEISRFFEVLAARRVSLIYGIWLIPCLHCTTNLLLECCLVVVSLRSSHSFGILVVWHDVAVSTNSRTQDRRGNARENSHQRKRSTRDRCYPRIQNS